MDRDSTFLLALVMLLVAAAVVGVSGWVLFVRERRVAKATGHHHREP
jgi:hypothetical protein